MSLDRHPTCVTYHPGTKFTRKDTGNWVHVPKTHMGLRCELCEWFLLFPTRVGLDRIEEIRQNHLGVVHFSELTAGRAQISEEPLKLRESVDA